MARPRAPPRGVAGNGPGGSLRASSRSTASSWGEWGPGGVARKNGCWPVLLGGAASWSLAMASWSCRGIVPCVVPPLKVGGLPVAPHGAGARACSMRGWPPGPTAGDACLPRWSWLRAGCATRTGCSRWPRSLRACCWWKAKAPRSSSGLMAVGCRDTPACSGQTGPGARPPGSPGDARPVCPRRARRLGR